MQSSNVPLLKKFLFEKCVFEDSIPRLPFYQFEVYYHFLLKVLENISFSGAKVAYIISRLQN